MRTLLPALLLISLGASACDDSAKTSPTAAASTSATAAASSARKVPPPPPPDGLDVATLQKTLKCGNGGHGPCIVLKAFKDCKDWLPMTESGDGRWLGKAYIVKKGTFVEDLVLLRSKRVNVSDVGPGQLNVKIAIADIPQSYPAEIQHAHKALRAFKRGDVTKASNQAVRYIKDRQDWPDAFVSKAKENQIFVADRGGAYLCQMKGDQRLLVVRKSNSRENPADGLYAEMYPVTW